MIKNTYELTQLIAEEGKILTNGTDYRTKIIGRTESLAGWAEVDISTVPEGYQV